jgi:hypothetical protein
MPDKSCLACLLKSLNAIAMAPDIGGVADLA